MQITAHAASDVLSETFGCLRASGMLMHHRRCYDDARCVLFPEFARALGQPAPVRVFLAMEGNAALGFLAGSIGSSAIGPVGRIHFFVVRPDAESRVAAALLDRALMWFEGVQAVAVRQSR